jgi:hypothetical protein
MTTQHRSCESTVTLLSSSSTLRDQFLRERFDEMFAATGGLDKIEKLQEQVAELNKRISDLQGQIDYMSERVWWKTKENGGWQ